MVYKHVQSKVLIYNFLCFSIFFFYIQNTLMKLIIYCLYVIHNHKNIFPILPLGHIIAFVLESKEAHGWGWLLMLSNSHVRRDETSKLCCPTTCAILPLYFVQMMDGYCRPNNFRCLLTYSQKVGLGYPLLHSKAGLVPLLHEILFHGKSSLTNTKAHVHQFPFILVLKVKQILLYMLLLNSGISDITEFITTQTLFNQLITKLNKINQIKIFF